MAVNPEKIRINVHVPKAVSEEIGQMAKELGTSKTGLASLMVNLGLHTVKMARDPMMKQYFETLVKESIDENYKTS